MAYSSYSHNFFPFQIQAVNQLIITKKKDLYKFPKTTNVCLKYDFQVEQASQYIKENFLKCIEEELSLCLSSEHYS